MAVEVKGTIQGIQTLVDGSVRVKVDIPHELVPRDVITWAFQEIKLVKEEDV